MTVHVGVPPQGEKVRQITETRLQQAQIDNGAKITVEYQGEQRHLHVISMPVAQLYLNPDTHRIRAQRTLDPQRDRLLQEAPWSEEAQAYLEQLLKAQPSNPDQTDPDYIALKEELDLFGQREPGIITPNGVLVDGNTRATALRELGEPNIRVGVLPPGATNHDINAVELYLQLRRDRRRDYSYINRLIAIDEQLRAGRRADDIARDFNIKSATLERDRWVYNLIQEAIQRSTTEDGVSLRLVDFEDHQEKLRELHRDFTKLAKTDPAGAEELKESRLAMVLLGQSKTDLRFVDAGFHNQFLKERLPESLRPAPASSTTVVIPGLGGVELESKGSAAKAVTDRLLHARATALAGDKLPREKVKEADALIQTAKKSFDAAADLAGRNGRLQKRKVAASERLSDAADLVQQCAKEFTEARTKRALDDEAFDDALVELRDSMARLAKLASRAYPQPGQGVEWLLTAAKDAT